MKFYRSKGLRADNDWDFGVIIGRFQARIGRYQFAVWWDYRPLINRYWAPSSRCDG